MFFEIIFALTNIIRVIQSIIETSLSSIAAIHIFPEMRFHEGQCNGCDLGSVYREREYTSWIEIPYYTVNTEGRICVLYRVDIIMDTGNLLPVERYRYNIIYIQTELRTKILYIQRRIYFLYSY